MSLALPEAFLLLAVPLLALLRRPTSHDGDAVYLPPALASRMSARRMKGWAASGWAPWIVWCLVVLALAGPRQLDTLDIVTASGRDVVVAIDLSGSMETEDFELHGQSVSRLAAVTDVAARFIEGRAGDRVGLVVFGDKAYIAAPLTHDVASVATVVRDLTIGVSGRSTAISDGLGLAMKRLDRDGAGSRVVILLSDGIDTTGTVVPAEAAAYASTLGIRIHTIALGPEDTTSAPDPRMAVDAVTLRRVAEASGGTMFRVRTSDELRSVAAAVDEMEPSSSKAPPVRTFRELWIWPAGAAVLLALILLAARARPSWPGPAQRGAGR